MSTSFSMTEGLPSPPERGVYFDNNATTAVAPEVLAAMVPLLTEHYGNPSSMHRFGARAGDELARARETRSKVIACLVAAARQVVQPCREAPK